ncbi:GNAT family N-acetyltransferase [Tropicibacter sp. R16_0]|uniref:GNAT family N-acetyltransferase n=1 Tax=Tropicibacter sp. R16_0 TaxID=2821102 RepID=UPI001ADAB58F|nr:GNAT family N-acetyltransferase [Tropicibacter sp. R16_0]MBO9453194.1 GNAT family N-acetyltransferase [Tropicibacter sp. R16_0]
MTHPIRLATQDDAAACAAIVSGWIDATPWIDRLHSLEELQEMIHAGIPLREFWVAGDPVAGYLSFNVDEGCVMGLYTAAPGSGVGKALLDQVKQGRDRVTLWSHLPNTGAHRFYRREGFAPTGEQRDGDDGLVEIEFAWER